MYVPVTMERRENINKFRKMPKVMAEPRCHLSFRTTPRFNLSFKEVESVKRVSVTAGKKGIPIHYKGKGVLL